VKEKMHSVYRVVRGDFDRQAWQAQKITEYRQRKGFLRVVKILKFGLIAAIHILLYFLVPRSAL
jgi:hypothetical protein